jgi:Cys-rich protein (TIGR01571 family)
MSTTSQDDNNSEEEDICGDEEEEETIGTPTSPMHTLHRILSSRRVIELQTSSSNNKEETLIDNDEKNITATTATTPSEEDIRSTTISSGSSVTSSSNNKKKQNSNTTTKNDQTWSTSLFACFSDWTVCLQATFCAPCSFPFYQSKFNNSNPWRNMCTLDLCGLRYEVREHYHIEGNCCTDCLANTFCYCCSTSQVMREIKMRGAVRSLPSELTVSHYSYNYELIETHLVAPMNKVMQN